MKHFIYLLLVILFSVTASMGMEEDELPNLLRRRLPSAVTVTAVNVGDNLRIRYSVRYLVRNRMVNFPLQDDIINSMNNCMSGPACHCARGIMTFMLGVSIYMTLPYEYTSVMAGMLVIAAGTHFYQAWEALLQRTHEYID